MMPRRDRTCGSGVPSSALCPSVSSNRITPLRNCSAPGVVFLAGRAVFQRDSQLRARLLDIAEAEVGGRKPETELVVVRIAIDFLREQVFRRLEIAIAHGGQAEVEEMEGRIGLQLLQLAGQSLGLRDATLVVENQCQIRHDLGIRGFELENVLEYLI